MGSGLFGTTSFRIMEQGLQFTSDNKKVIAHNISNVDTPGYKTKYLSFSGVLRDKMNVNSRFKKELHLEQNDLYIDEITKGQPDGNNVDYEVQSALLKSNAIRQEAIINQIESEFRMMRAAMRKS
ncbi:MAG: flagellar basal body rod protein FlgB [Oscillospiraceae bacterium]|nr:flagellar basal body rod protein FlgB [Oscillospiraceae bacterium]